MYEYFYCIRNMSYTDYLHYKLGTLYKCWVPKGIIIFFVFVYSGVLDHFKVRPLSPSVLESCRCSILELSAQFKSGQVGRKILCDELLNKTRHFHSGYNRLVTNILLHVEQHPCTRNGVVGIKKNRS